MQWDASRAMRRTAAGALAVLTAGLAATAPAPVHAQEKVMKAVLHADVRVLDPHWTDDRLGFDPPLQQLPQLVVLLRDLPHHVCSC